MVQLPFPFRLSVTGRTADNPDYLRGLIMQVLFTAPGERVHRPEFGADISRLVFEGETEDTRSATQLLVQGALLQWLGDRIDLQRVHVDALDGLLEIRIEFIEKASGKTRAESFEVSADGLLPEAERPGAQSQ